MDKSLPYRMFRCALLAIGQVFAVLGVAASVALFPAAASAQVRTLPAQPATIDAARAGIDVYLVNEGGGDAAADAPATIEVTTLDGVRLTVAQQDAPPATIAAGAFVKLRYAAQASAAAPLAMTAPSASETVVAAAQGNASGFLDRFEPYAPVYGVFGAGDAGAKLQVSFAFRPFDDAGALDGLRFAWTQTMFWAIDEPSGPFRSTNYAPELFYVHNLSDTLTVSGGYRHDSNGRGDIGSIDANRLYAQIAKRWDLGNDWSVVAAPRVWAYVGKQGAAPDLDRYWGFTALHLGIGQRDGVRLAIDARGNPGTGRGAAEAYLSYPLARIGGGLGIYAFGQGFTGYGEAIDDYALQRTHARFGIALTR
ncbi:phospholipase A [Sphingomonas japonica]|uniref:Phospholipase A1 n=1 Tax=Sphingomonas japonica TaxID=511662 RepID=A0ABX0U229_9SPHN|nr:phospholipase A [Sphingomonas japonica]NIJ23397.1 outer membrane phospholipase A [Sphingomonas japonica]